MPSLERLASIKNQYAPGFAACDNAFQFCYSKLFGVSFDKGNPTWQCHNDNSVDLRIVLESLHRMDDDWLVVDMQELLGDVLPHARAGSCGRFSIM